MRGTPEERFWARVDVNGPVPDQSDPLVRVSTNCWLGMAAGVPRPDRYMSLYVDGRYVPAARWAYEHFVGPIPEGQVPDHLCRVVGCVRFPDHLEPVSRQENLARGVGPAAVVIRTGRCLRGHEEDWYVSPDGRRYCRACRREGDRRRYRVRRRSG